MAKTKSQKVPTAENAAVAEWVSQHVQIIDVRLIESTAQQHLKIGPFPTNAEQEVNVGIGFDDGAGQMMSRFTYTMRVRYSDAPVGDTPAVSISGTYQVTYAVSGYEGVTQDQAAMFCQQQGIMTTWPFWRELVNSMTGRMGLPPITMQLMRPTQLHKQNPPQPVKAPSKRASRRKNR